MNRQVDSFPILPSQIIGKNSEPLRSLREIKVLILALALFSVADQICF